MPINEFFSICVLEFKIQPSEFWVMTYTEFDWLCKHHMERHSKISKANNPFTKDDYERIKETIRIENRRREFLNGNRK